MRLTIGYSPCPNDCFIFDALVHKKIDTEGIDFDVRLEDVETLNRMATRSELDISKLSFHAFGHVADKYILLRSGSALGFNCGPLLVSKQEVHDTVSQIKSVAIPGKLTTANFLLSIALPSLTNKKEYLFSDIEDAVLKGEADAGLIIHENRFTYADKGLKKVMDLGEFWDGLIHAPIPLGGIAMRRKLESALTEKVNRLIRGSVAFAFANPAGAMPYVRTHAQALSEAVMKKHIDLYVNEYSLDLGERGVEAIRLMMRKGEEVGLFPLKEEKLVID